MNLPASGLFITALTLTAPALLAPSQALPLGCHGAASGPAGGDCAYLFMHFCRREIQADAW